VRDHKMFREQMKISNSNIKCQPRTDEKLLNSAQVNEKIIIIKIKTYLLKQGKG
jgi:hypothetical protein